ncbi:MAG: hypothetical protein LQ350_003944 [Teloschistes chrysophthalmus]|nr:MAG: hypothetical protein LQ350_003944 [Niorma chrysophthalma]
MDLLRPYLLPLTHSLPAPLVQAGHSLLGPTCYKTLLLDLDVDPRSPCFSLLISKTIGVGIITLSSIIKIPQILKIINSQTAAGISMPSVLLETFSYVVTVAYSARSGFPFTAWGETALIAVQDVVICALVFVLGQSAPTRRAMEKKKKEGGDAGGQQGKVLASVFVGVVAAGVYALQDTKVVDMGTLQTLQAGAGAVGVLSKAPQIWSNWQMGGTGQLSAFTVFLYLAGSLSRIFTTLQEVPDRLILYGFMGAFLLNGVLAAQMVYYWRSPATEGHGEEIGEKGRRAVAAVEEKGGAASATGMQGRGKGPSTRRRG